MGALNWTPIMPRDASLSDSEYEYFSSLDDSRKTVKILLPDDEATLIKNVRTFHNKKCSNKVIQEFS